MKIAIAGFPGSGKSTVFKAVTNFKRPTEDFSKPCLGTVKIKDERLDRLASILRPKKVVYEELIFTDLPGFNLGPIKSEETIIHVLGVFSGRDYKKDIENIETEFMVSDLAIIEKRLPILEKELKAKASNEKENEKDILLSCKKTLDENTPIRAFKVSPKKMKFISGYQFLSQKPVFIVANLDENQINSGLVKEIDDWCKGRNFRSISLCAKVEAELQDLEEDDKLKFAKEMGLDKLVAEKVVDMARKVAGLITFFTGSLNGNEARAWPVPEGITAWEAAGKIHTDMQKGFIKAEVVGFDDFIKCGSFHEAKGKGLLLLEGKDYIVKEGDIITFRFNV